jgi:hypothetical protein
MHTPQIHNSITDTVHLFPRCCTDASRPAWLAPFRTRNSVTLDSTTGTATLAGGPPAPGQLSPSAALLSVNSYDGDLQINVTLSGWEILQ